MRFFIRGPGLQQNLGVMPDDHFRAPAPLSLADRIFRGAILVALIAGGLGLAALAFWFALLMIPVAIVAGLLAWAALRWKLWRGRGSFGGQRDPFRRW